MKRQNSPQHSEGSDQQVEGSKRPFVLCCVSPRGCEALAGEEIQLFEEATPALQHSPRVKNLKQVTTLSAARVDLK